MPGGNNLMMYGLPPNHPSKDFKLPDLIKDMPAWNQAQKIPSNICMSHITEVDETAEGNLILRGAEDFEVEPQRLFDVLNAQNLFLDVLIHGMKNRTAMWAKFSDTDEWLLMGIVDDRKAAEQP